MDWIGWVGNARRIEGWARRSRGEGTHTGQRSEVGVRCRGGREHAWRWGVDAVMRWGGIRQERRGVQWRREFHVGVGRGC